MLFDPKWEEKVEVKLKPWQESLLKAAAFLEKHEWTQGALEKDGGFCMLGAVQKVTYGVTTKYRRYEADMYTTVFNKLTRNLLVSPASWNDARHRTKEEVIAKLREVANVV